MRQQNAGNLGELLSSARLGRGAASVEQYIGHVDDQTASRVARLQDGIELFQQLRAELGLFGLCLRGSLQRLLCLGFGGALLFESRLARFLGFGFLRSGLLGGLLGFELHALGLGASLFRLLTSLLGLKAGLLRICAALGFGIGVG